MQKKHDEKYVSGKACMLPSLNVTNNLNAVLPTNVPRQNHPKPLCDGTTRKIMR